MPFTRRHFITTAAAALCCPLGVQALPLDMGWQHQTFPRKDSNSFIPGPRSITVQSNDSVSLLMRQLPQAQWGAVQVNWRWDVSTTVPPTDLTRKGGDDRNLALYFVFLPLRDAIRLSGASVRKVLGARAARMLIYTWGGDYPRGAVFDNPWLRGKGATVAMRPAGMGSHHETVDLHADFARAFDRDPGVLFGLALSADSDDTESRISAKISDLTLG